MKKPCFIRDGFAFFAFICTVPWLLVQRLWFEAALVFGVTVVISGVGNIPATTIWPAFVTALLSLLVGFEGNNWRVAALERRGFEQLGVVDAHNADDAETAWFLGPNFVPSAQTAAGRLVAKADTPLLSRRPTSRRSAGMVGLVSHRGEN